MAVERSLRMSAESVSWERIQVRGRSTWHHIFGRGELASLPGVNGIAFIWYEYAPKDEAIQTGAGGL